VCVSAENSFHGRAKCTFWVVGRVRRSRSSGNLRKFASRFGKGSCLVCFAIFGRFLGFGGKRFSRGNVPEMTELEGLFESGKIGEK